MFQQFFNRYNGQFVDFDNAYGAQCFDLVNKYSTEMGYQRFTGLYASGIYNQPGSNYTQIPNSPSAVPQAGDIIVWNNNYGGGFGHTAIANGDGNTTYFVSFDQNWQPGSPAVLVRHNYNGVIGWLRPKNNTPTGGGGSVTIGSGENWYARLDKLHQQVRGRSLGRDVFNAFVGRDTLSFIEAVSDDKEADIVQNWQDVGKIAVNDKWQQQIYTLQAQLKSASELATQLNERLVKAEADTKAMTAKVETLEKKVAELDNPDNIVVSRGFFNGLFDKIKNLIGKG